MYPGKADEIYRLLVLADAVLIISVSAKFHIGTIIVAYTNST